MDYLWYWKKHLPCKKFFVLLETIEKESFYEMRHGNKKSLEMIEKLLNPFREEKYQA
jgi:hypothetical protein